MLILLYKSLFLTVKVCYMYLCQEYDQSMYFERLIIYNYVATIF